MHKLSSNFYIKSLIRSLKECKCYNEKTKHAINKLIFKKLKYNSDFQINMRLFPHVLLNEIDGYICDSYYSVKKIYENIIINKMVDDVSTIIINHLKKPNKEEILDNINRRRLYWYLEKECKIPSITLDNSNIIFYPEIITTV